MGAQQLVAHIHWHDTPGLYGGDHADIPANALLIAEDVDLSLGSPRRLGGYSLIGTTTGGAGGIRAGFDWDPDGSSQIDVLLTASGTVLKETASGSGSYTTLVTGLDMSLTNIFVEGGAESTGQDRKLFLFTGANPVRVLTGTGTSMATMAYPPSDWDGADQPMFGTIHDGRMFAGGVRSSPHRLYYSDDADHEKFTTSLFRKSVRFDGTTYLARGAGLTGAADTSVGTLSVWLRIDNDTQGDAMHIIDSTGNSYQVRRSKQNKIRISAENAAGTEVLIMTSKHNWTSKDGWFHLMASWNLATTQGGPIGYMYVNNKEELATGSTFTAATIDYTVANHYVGASPTASGFLQGRIQQLYFNTAEYVNLSTPGNRELFYDKGAEDLGADGSDPTGTAPIVFLNDTATGFTTNLGGGGNYSVAAGALIDNNNVPSRGTLGGDPGSFNVFTGVGEQLISGVSFRGFLICFKRPRGVFAVNTQDVDQVNWQQQILSHNIGLAHPRAWVITEDNVIFMSSDGDFHAISILQSEHQNSASITRVMRFDQWMDKNLTQAAKEALKTSSFDAVYYPAKKCALFKIDFVPSDGLGGNLIAIDFSNEHPRFHVCGKNASTGLSGMWMMRDAGNVLRPAFGGATGTAIGGKYFLFPSVTTYANELASGGALPTFNLRTPNIDFREMDPALMDVRKNGRWLEVVYEPCTGSVTLAAEIFWDGNSTATITFPISASTGIGYARRRLTGAGRTFGVRLYQPTPSTTTHAFAISNLNVYFVPGAQSPT